MTVFVISLIMTVVFQMCSRVVSSVSQTVGHRVKASEQGTDVSIVASRNLRGHVSVHKCKYVDVTAELLVKLLMAVHQRGINVFLCSQLNAEQRSAQTNKL